MYTLDKPSEHHYPTLEEIYIRASKCFLNLYSTDEEIENYNASFLSADFLNEISKERIILCAFNGENKPIGFICYRKKSPHVVWVHSVYVDPDYQRHGVGKLLLESVDSYALINNISLISLETDTRASWAIPFYISSGFKVVNDLISMPPYDLITSKPLIEGRTLLAKLVTLA